MVAFQYHDGADRPKALFIEEVRRMRVIRRTAGIATAVAVLALAWPCAATDSLAPEGEPAPGDSTGRATGSLGDPLVPVGVTLPSEPVIAPAHNLEAYRCEPFECALMTLGHRRDWRRIEWRQDLPAALEEARRCEKPIAVVMMLREYSQFDAGFN